MKIILICTPLRFYAKNDEIFFFEWLKKIRCIKDVKGVGKELHLEISADISDKEILEIIGIFKRYNFDLKKLETLKNNNNKELFENIIT